MEEPRKFSIVLVPFPITVLSAFAFFFYRQIGLIDSSAHVFYHWRPNSLNAKVALDNKITIRLFGFGLHERLRLLIKDSAAINRYLCLRILNFLSCPPDKAAKKQLENLFVFLNQASGLPEVILEIAERIFRHYLDAQIDPFRQGLPFSSISREPTTKREVNVLPLSKQFLTMPVFETTLPEERKIVGCQELVLTEGRAWQLMNYHLGIVVGGPSGSGKSTITASLYEEVERLIRSLKTRADWQQFNLSVTYVNCDLGTPTVEAILNAQGQNREALLAKKRPWTFELALEALAKFSRAKKSANIIIADLSGKIDQLTEIMAAPGDVGIVITKDWARMNEWQKFLARMGIICVAQARTRLAEEGLESVVKRYHPGEIIAGRVSGLERVIRSWDPFISLLAKVLLFDLLPSVVERRQKIISNYSVDD